MPDGALYHKKVLKNGLTVLCVPIESASSVTMSVFVKAGSRYEEAKINGISHFLEHLHFKGTKKFPTAKKLSETVDSIGGEFNANTGKEHTQYYIRAAYEHLQLVFDVLTEMIQNPLFDEKEIEREKGVIVEEINMYKDNPQIHVESLFEATLWPNTPLGRDIAGEAPLIQAMKRKDILDYRAKFYRPSNMIIAVSGKFDPKQLEDLVGKNWSHLNGKNSATYDAIVYKQNAPKLIVQNKVTEQAHMIVGFPAFSYRNKHNNTLRILTAVLGGGMSSRLFIRVRERMGLAYYVSASFNNYLDSGNFMVQAGLKVASAKSALDIILEELRKVKKDGISNKELIKAKEYIKGKIALAMEDPHDKLEWYLGQEAFIGKIRTIKQAFVELDAVKLEQVSKIANDIIRNENLTMALIGPFADKGEFEKRLKI
ncbi:MAG TPA: pitrilysin family protein [Patescibacteria group bacterium]|jgi:predicted Zn-dependent peptidase|nr:pitrilysin family protein [Patescibacteria group bacterium]